MSPPDPEAQPAGDGEEREDVGPEAGPGVLGSLPRARPSVRSPRRDQARAAGPTTEPGPTADRDREAAEGEPRTGREAEIEALARAGVSLAGEAASLGLRVAGRAAAALRDAVERS